MRMRFQRGNRSHEALKLPDDEGVREHACKRLASFLKLHIDLEDESSNETSAA